MTDRQFMLLMRALFLLLYALLPRDDEGVKRLREDYIKLMNITE